MANLTGGLISGFGLLFSIPEALITKAYAPIFVIGSLGGPIIGGILHGWK